METPICCLDITSSSIKIIVGYLFKGQVYILDALESNSTYLVNGHVEDEDKMSKAIQELVKSIYETLNIKIEEVVVGFYPYKFKKEVKNDSTTLTSSAGKVQYFDAKNLISKFKNSNLNDDLAICDISPDYFYLDDDTTYKDFPKDFVSRSLGMEANIYYVDKSYYDEIIKVLNKANLKVKFTCLVPNACYKYIYSFLNNPKSDFIYLDFQERNTYASISINGVYSETNIINYGSNNIVNDLENKLGVSPTVANEYKNYYGLSEGPKFSFKTKNGHTISQINQAIKDSLTTLSQDLYGFIMTLAPEVRTRIIFSGDGCCINGINKYLNEQTRLSIDTFTPICYGARNEVYTNCVSILYYYCNYQIKTQNEQTNLTFTRTDTDLDIKKVNDNLKVKQYEIL